MMEHTKRIRAALGVPPPVPPVSMNRGNQPDQPNKRSGRIRKWLNAIERDRNYARVLLFQPLAEPVTPEFRAWADGWWRRNRRVYARPPKSYSGTPCAGANSISESRRNSR